MVGRYSAYRRGPDPVVNPDIIDRIMIGACAAVWLVLVGVSVAAGVALADLSRGFHKSASSPHTTWVLYFVIVVSALIIAVAIPILLRARRQTRLEPIVRSRALQGGIGRQSAVRAGTRATVEPLRRETVTANVPPVNEWSAEAVDRIWVRGTVALTTAIGAALIAVALATYLMAANHDGAAWTCYGLAGVVVAGMPAIEWFYVHQLRQGPETH